MTAPASAAPGAGDPARRDRAPARCGVNRGGRSRALALRGVPSGALEDRAGLVRFVVRVVARTDDVRDSPRSHREVPVRVNKDALKSTTSRHLRTSENSRQENMSEA